MTIAKVGEAFVRMVVIQVIDATGSALTELADATDCGAAINPTKSVPGLAWVLALGLTAPGCRDRGEIEVVAVPEATFVADRECHTCHQSQHQSWLGSHHHLAMQPATPEFVKGNFEDSTFTHHGVTTRFFQRDGSYFVNAEGSDGALTDFEVKYVFGVEPLQQLLIEFDRGRMQCLTVAWDTIGERWFSLYEERFPAEDPMHWTGLQQNWNYMCAECHSTDLRRGWDDTEAAYDTTWKEISVGCQACHGPGSLHVDWAATADASAVKDDDRKGLAVSLDGNPRTQIESCARCHSRRSLVSDRYHAGDRFLDHYELQLPNEPLYHVDGQIRDEVYVYGSFLQSKKVTRGVRCSDCHDPHSARLVAEGNALCVRCHSENPPAQFPTIVKQPYDDVSHHHHPAGGPGTNCVDCHMLERTFMVVDPRRDHSFRIPRPDLSDKLGTPNACTDCHSDRDAAWAAAAIAEWTGGAELLPHWSEAIVAGGARLDSLVRDLDVAGIVRATALERRLQAPDAALLDLVTGALEDPDALVRVVAVRGVETALPSGAPPAAVNRKKVLLVPRLVDEVRLVRVEAARVLTTVPRGLLSEDEAASFDRAFEETIARHRALFDRPDGHFNLALLRDNLGDPEAAAHEYRVALERDASFLPARFNLATLLSRLGRHDEAERELLAVVEDDPLNGEAHYSLGLLRAEMGRTADAAVSLDRAARFLEGRSRVRYNLALCLQQLDRLDEAEAAMQDARRIDPADADILYAIALLLARRGRLEEAREATHELLLLGPADPRARELLRNLEARIRREG